MSSETTNDIPHLTMDDETGQRHEFRSAAAALRRGGRPWAPRHDAR
jgi:hypothetical protein